MSKINERIKTAREKKALPLQKAAELLDVSPEMLEKWESGESEPDTFSAFRMAEIYSVTADYILFGADGRAASQTMFPKEVKPEFSAYANWKVLVGALMMFCGVGGGIIMILRAIGLGYNTVRATVEFCGISLLVFALIFTAGLLFAVISVAVGKSKHKKKERSEK